MHCVLAIEPKWLSETAPAFFKVADANKISKRKKQERYAALTFALCQSNLLLTFFFPLYLFLLHSGSSRCSTSTPSRTNGVSREPRRAQGRRRLSVDRCLRFLSTPASLHSIPLSIFTIACFHVSFGSARAEVRVMIMNCRQEGAKKNQERMRRKEGKGKCL